MLTEYERNVFKNHKATLSDFGMIKVLDFQAPGSSYYRIRFLFEEDCYRLHISGDLGELIATNNSNMTYEKFAEAFADNLGYFQEKVDCHNRAFYVYNQKTAETALKEYLEEYDVLQDVLTHNREEWETDDETLDGFFEDVFSDFTKEHGLGSVGCKILGRYFPDPWEFAPGLGQENTNILELYMYAFKMAKAQIDSEKKPTQEE